MPGFACCIPSKSQSSLSNRLQGIVSEKSDEALNHHIRATPGVSSHGILHIIKVAVLFKCFHSFTTMSVKISIGFFQEFGKLNLHIY